MDISIKLDNYKNYNILIYELLYVWSSMDKFYNTYINGNN